MTYEEYATCIQACVECAQACERCADACLSERDVGVMVECIRLDGDCSSFCWMAAGLMSRDSEFAEQFCLLCAEVCDACGTECRKHNHEHCQNCAEACQRCARECRRITK